MTTAIFEFPLSPTINSYYGLHGHRRYMTEKGKQFKKEVAYIVSQQAMRFGKSLVAIHVVIHFSNRRVQDLSNRLKALEDAMVQAGLMDDDSQIKKIVVEEGEIIKGGKMLVKVEAFPACRLG